MKIRIDTWNGLVLGVRYQGGSLSPKMQQALKDKDELSERIIKAFEESKAYFGDWLALLESAMTLWRHGSAAEFNQKRQHLIEEIVELRFVHGVSKKELSLINQFCRFRIGSPAIVKHEELLTSAEKTLAASGWGFDCISRKIKALKGRGRRKELWPTLICAAYEAHRGTNCIRRNDELARKAISYKLRVWCLIGLPEEYLDWRIRVPGAKRTNPLYKILENHIRRVA